MKSRSTALLLTALLLTTAGSTAAQGTYRWVDPASGRTVISDTPPPSGAKNARQSGVDRPGTTPPSYAIQRATDSAPVTLYTAPDCKSECQEARDLLRKRNVPFNEKPVRTQGEVDELKALLKGEQPMVPTIAVGSQTSRGLSAEAWNKLLDTAGYPGMTK
jgi:glutaredoxin